MKNYKKTLISMIFILGFFATNISAKAHTQEDSIKIVKRLNGLLADEWLAYYQYWIGAKVVQSPIKKEVIAELDEHATEELEHAQMLVKRIIQLGGTPILNPNTWSKLAGCKYLEPSDPRAIKILKQNIKSEECAIEAYKKAINEVDKKDSTTQNILSKILKDEIKHKEDLNMLLIKLQK